MTNTAATESAPTTLTAPVRAARVTIADKLNAALTLEGVIPAPKDAAATGQRLIELGFGVDCSRCYGSGSYGPLSVDGARCWGCNGRRIMAPKATRELLARVVAEVTPDRLRKLVADRTAAKAARVAAKGSGARVMAAYATTAFMRYAYGRPASEGGREEGWVEPTYSPLAYAIHENESPLRDAHRDAEFAASRGTGDAATVLRLEAEIVRARAIQDLAFAAALADGAVARSAVWSDALKAATRYESYDAPPVLTGREGLAAEAAERRACEVLAAEYLAAAAATLAAREAA